MYEIIRRPIFNRSFSNFFNIINRDVRFVISRYGFDWLERFISNLYVRIQILKITHESIYDRCTKLSKIRCAESYVSLDYTVFSTGTVDFIF